MFWKSRWFAWSNFVTSTAAKTTQNSHLADRIICAVLAFFWHNYSFGCHTNWHCCSTWKVKLQDSFYTNRPSVYDNRFSSSLISSHDPNWEVITVLAVCNTILPSFSNIFLYPNRTRLLFFFTNVWTHSTLAPHAQKLKPAPPRTRRSLNLPCPIAIPTLVYSWLCKRYTLALLTNCCVCCAVFLILILYLKYNQRVAFLMFHIMQESWQQPWVAGQCNSCNIYCCHSMFDTGISFVIYSYFRYFSNVFFIFYCRW